MVHTGDDRVSLSCCIRRDQLARCRQRWPHVRAGETVLTHIKSTCKGAADVMHSAQLADAWLSAGPLRTGIHSFGEEGIFAVGNAAAEAHPIVAEGISMAVQSAFLLCTELLDSKLKTHSQIALDAIRNKYEVAWRENFSARVRVAAVLAHVFMHPLTAGAAAMAIRCFPQLLTEGSRWSGKAQAIRNATTTTSLVGKTP